MDQAGSSRSLRKVFENCACTQTSCTCDFVEQLINRFAKVDIPGSTACDSKCLQTDQNEIQTVGLQTRIETQNQNQQTPVLTVDDKCLQTEKHMSKSESQSVGIQTLVNIQNQNQQTNISADAQTEILKLGENVGTQAATRIKDQILEKSQSVEQRKVLKSKVDTHINVNGETQTKEVNFVSETISTTHSTSASPDHVKNKKDASVFPILDFDGIDSNNIRRQQDAATSPVAYRIGTTSDHVVKKKDATTSPRMDLAKYIKKQLESGSQAVTTNSTRSHSDSSQPTSSSKTSTSTSTSDRQKKKILHVCCCSQTDSKPHDKNRRRNVRVQVESSGTYSDKENAKHKVNNLTTNSIAYEICPSILVSSYNGMYILVICFIYFYFT